MLVELNHKNKAKNQKLHIVGKSSDVIKTRVKT